MTFERSLVTTDANRSRRAQAIPNDTTRTTIAGAGEPPRMNRWVPTAPIIMGISRSAPNAANDGIASSTADATSIEPTT